MKEKYRVGEVEELLGIPRTTIRYYIKKGILKVDKDESNGYRYFTQKNVFDLMYILIGRNVLEMSVENANERIHAKSLEDFSAVFQRQEKILHTRIANANRSLEVLSIYGDMLKRIQGNLNQIEIIEAGPFHILSSKYLLNAKTSAFDIGFHAAIYKEGAEEPIFDTICSFIHDCHKHLVDKEDFDTKLYTVNNKRYVFTVIESEAELSSPENLAALLSWCKEQKIALEPPFYQIYLFRVEHGDTPLFYYEFYLPIAD